tara:strand:+ start:4901 stop:5176 length:276 start_codon:yes stop_codon:yes gene_type:complete
MKTKFFTSILTLSTLVFTLTAHAHDPKEHMQNAEKPDCAAMKNMDNSKMDMSDPITQAMMKQCMDTPNKDQKPENDHDGHSTGDETMKHNM